MMINVYNCTWAPLKSKLEFEFDSVFQTEDTRKFDDQIRDLVCKNISDNRNKTGDGRLMTASWSCPCTWRRRTPPKTWKIRLSPGEIVFIWSNSTKWQWISLKCFHHGQEIQVKTVSSIISRDDFRIRIQF